MLPFLASGPYGVPALVEGKWQVSKDVGTQPKWRADGKEIFFQAPPNGTVKMAVDVKVARPLNLAFRSYYFGLL